MINDAVFDANNIAFPDRVRTLAMCDYGVYADEVVEDHKHMTRFLESWIAVLTNYILATNLISKGGVFEMHNMNAYMDDIFKYGLYGLNSLIASYMLNEFEQPEEAVAE